MGITRFGKHYPKKKFAMWRDAVVRDLIHYLNEIDFLTSIDQNCKLSVLYWAVDKRRRDVPAMMDALFHVFERSGLITDDSLIKDVNWQFQGLDRKNPRATCSIEVK